MGRQTSREPGLTRTKSLCSCATTQRRTLDRSRPLEDRQARYLRADARCARLQWWRRWWLLEVHGAHDSELQLHEPGLDDDDSTGRDDSDHAGLDDAGLDDASVDDASVDDH